jgi:hypothetical protein
MLALCVWSDANALPVYLDCAVIRCLMRGYVRHYVVTLWFCHCCVRCLSTVGAAAADSDESYCNERSSVQQWGCAASHL